MVFIYILTQIYSSSNVLNNINLLQIQYRPMFHEIKAVKFEKNSLQISKQSVLLQFNTATTTKKFPENFGRVVGFNFLGYGSGFNGRVTGSKMFRSSPSVHGLKCVLIYLGPHMFA